MTNSADPIAVATAAKLAALPPTAAAAVNLNTANPGGDLAQGDALEPGGASADSAAGAARAAAEARFKAWRDAGRHLPPELRDFHDQKAFFRTMHAIQEPSLQAKGVVRRPDWVEGHCYVIDQFLWFMASHGYILQKSRAALPFASLAQTVSEVEAQRRQGFARMLQETPAQAGVATPDSRSAPQD